MKSSLQWKLLSIHLLVIGVVILVIWLAFDYRAAAYFTALMETYNIAPQILHQMFLRAVHRHLLLASLLALALCLVLSVLLTYKVLRTLFQMIEVTRKIAGGNYTARVEISSADEVGQLARAFNRMTDSLQRLEHQRKTMVIDIAHELRTPLTNMRGYLEALGDGVLPPSKETFELLHEETLRLVKLAEDLLQLARADASRTTLQRQEVRLQQLIAQALTLFHSQFAAKTVAVETHFVSGVDQVMADADKLVQVMHNLLQNALQYTPSGGRLSIAVERLPARIKVTFANTGEEIAQEDLPFVFDRFYRGEKSRSREYGGEGIGLAIVKVLIEAHGGEVAAESSLGEIRIWFTLPT